MGDISSLAYIGSSLISAGGQYFTNASNANLNKNNRDWQERINREAREYNLPSAQKSRLEQAGINPYSVMAGDGADVGNSNAEGSNPPSSIPYQNPIQQNVALDLLQGMKLASEKEGQDIKNETDRTNLAFLETQKLLDISETRARIRKLLASKDVDEAYKDYLRTQDAVLEGQATSILKKSRAEANQADTVSQNLQRQYDDQHYESVANRALSKAQIRVSRAQVSQIGQAINESIQRVENLKKEKELTEKQIKTEIANEAEKIINTYLNLHGSKREDKKIKSEIASEMWRIVMESSEIKLPFGSLRPPHPAINHYVIKQNKDNLDWLDEDW